MNAKFSKKNGHAHFSEKTAAYSPANLLRNTAKVFLFTVLLTVVISLFAAAMFYASADPTRYISPISVTLFCIAAFVGGFLSAKKQKGSALLCGLLFCAMWLTLTGIASFLFDLTWSANHSFAAGLVWRGIAVCLSVFGAFLAVSKKKKPSGKRNRR